MRNLLNLLVISAALLSGCGGKGDGKVCHSMAASGSSVTASPGASVGNLGEAADGDFGTFATLNINSGTASIRATAQSGIVFPAGQTIGADWSNNSGSAYNLVLNTYLSGVLQEAFTICGACGANNPSPAQYDHAVTNKSFDAVEIQLTGNQTGTQQAVFEVNELCDS